MGRATAKCGREALGSGPVRVRSSGFRRAYLLGGALTPEQVLSRFQTLISPYVRPEYRIANDSGVYHRGGFMTFPYHNGQGHTILHLVNSDYDPFQARFAEKGKP